MLEVPRYDIDQRIGDTLSLLFSFRQDDGTLRSFASSEAIFHAQSGAETIHLSSATPGSGVSIVDVGSSPLGPGGVDCGIMVKIPYTTTENWEDQQKWLYETEEWVSGERYTLVDGIITAVLGVVDGAD